MKSTTKENQKLPLILDMLRDDVSTTIIKNRLSVSGSMIKKIKEDYSELLKNTRHYVENAENAPLSQTTNKDTKDEIQARMAKARDAKARKAVVVANKTDDAPTSDMAQKPQTKPKSQKHPKYDAVAAMVKDGKSYKDIQTTLGSGASTNLISQVKRDLGFPSRNKNLYVNLNKDSVNGKTTPTQKINHTHIPKTQIQKQPEPTTTEVLSSQPDEPQTTVVRITPNDLISVVATVTGSVTTISIDIKQKS
jgi:hypothetical protein